MIADISTALTAKSEAETAADKLPKLPVAPRFLVGYVDVDKTAAACGGGTANGTCYLAHLDFLRPVSSFTVTLPSGHTLGGWSCSPVGGVAGWAGASPTTNSFRCDWNTSGAPADKAVVGFQAAPDIDIFKETVGITAGGCPQWCEVIDGIP